MKAIAFTGLAARQRAKLDAAIRARIDGKLDAYAKNGQGDVKRLSGRDGARLRVGDWRVIFHEENNMILVMAVGHRREIYD
jgi:mRNA interferase RelE/StbE